MWGGGLSRSSRSIGVSISSACEAEEKVTRIEESVEKEGDGEIQVGEEGVELMMQGRRSYDVALVIDVRSHSVRSQSSPSVKRCRNLSGESESRER